MRLSYEEVLKEFAHHVGLESEALLHTEEVLIDGFPIGLQLEGSPVSGDVLFFTTLGTPSPEHLGRIAIDDNLGGESLAALLGGFVDTAAFWKAFVEGTPEGDGGTLLPPSFAMRA